MIIIEQNSSLSTEACSLMIHFKDGHEIKFITKADDLLKFGEKSFLICQPSITTCAMDLLSLIFGSLEIAGISFDNGGIIDLVGQLRIKSNGHKLLLEWLGKDPPNSFYELQDEINRIMNMKAFW